MVLIAILFCLALQRFASVGGWFQPSWFEAYLRRLTPWLIKLNEWLVVAVIIVPVLLLLVLLQFVFAWHFFGLFNLIFATFILFLCIDARDFKNKLNTYFTNLEKDDVQAAADVIANFTGGVSFSTVGGVCRAVTEVILLKSFEQLFAGLFWFMVFGVYGVTVYFLITLLRQNALKVDSNYAGLVVLATRIQNILDWIPSRLVGVSYALVGNFTKGFGYCSNHLWSGLTEESRFPIDAGLAALDAASNFAQVNPKENHEALDLINRVLIVWLVALALVLLGIWL